MVVWLAAFAIGGKTGWAPSEVSALSLYGVAALLVTLGVVGVFVGTRGRPWMHRGLIAVLYAPLYFLALLFGALWFECSRDNCL